MTVLAFNADLSAEKSLNFDNRAVSKFNLAYASPFSFTKPQVLRSALLSISLAFRFESQIMNHVFLNVAKDPNCCMTG